MHRARSSSAADRPFSLHRPSSLPIAFAGLSCAVALAACGGSGTGHSASSTPYGPKNSPASLSRCMRANGLSGFPDPVAGPGGVGFPQGLMTSIGGDNLVVDGVSFTGPALQSAEKACKEFLPPGGPPPAISESQKLAALAHARCMRTHGVPNFPDPTFPSGGGVRVTVGPANAESPAFQQAAVACRLSRP